MIRNILTGVISALFTLQTYASTGALSMVIEQNYNQAGLQKSDISAIVKAVADADQELAPVAEQVRTYHSNIDTASKLNVSYSDVIYQSLSPLAALSKSKPEIEDSIKAFRAFNKENARVIYDLSKQTYSPLASAKMVHTQMLIYSSLLAQRDSYKSMVESLMPIAILAGTIQVADPKNLTPEDLELLNFRQLVLHEYLTNQVMVKLVENDIQDTARTLTDLKKNKSLDVSTDKAIAESLAAVSTQAKAERNVFRSKMKKDYKAPAPILDLMSQMKGKSLLYSPDQDASIVANIVSWVGNLTWGLCNTLIGLGAVIVSFVVTPIGALMYEGQIRFPSFAISSSGSQIYVNMPYMGMMPGKMSMGLFELDNTGSYDWESEHEGVHAIQSATLGPIYLPTILATYLIFGFDQGPLEEMADYYAGRI